MGRERTTDLALVVGVVLSTAVFGVSLLAVAGFASVVAAPSLKVEATQNAIQHVEGATGLDISVDQQILDGYVTVNFDMADMDPRLALDRVLGLAGLECVERDGVLLITKKKAEAPKTVDHEVIF